jgi:hypothetical protein
MAARATTPIAMGRTGGSPGLFAGVLGNAVSPALGLELGVSEGLARATSVEGAADGAAAEGVGWAAGAWVAFGLGWVPVLPVPPGPVVLVGVAVEVGGPLPLTVIEPVICEPWK